METVEEIKTRLNREDEEKEKAFQKRLKEIDAGNAKWRAEKEKEQRAKELATEKLISERQEKREQEMKDSARNSYLVAGGSEEDFEEAWPEIKAEMLKRRTIEAEAQTRARLQRHYSYTF
jgi:hypothetical protein